MFGRDSLKMRFEILVAWRYLLSSRVQTALILLGVIVGVIVYTFIASLINGLRVRLTEDVVGNIAHVRLEVPDRVPQLLENPSDDSTALVAVQRGEQPREEISGWRQLIVNIENTPGVKIASPQATGSGFIQKGEQLKPVEITGVEPEKVSAITDIAGGLIRGTTELASGDVLIGKDLADDLGVSTGQRLQIRSGRNRERSLVIRGIFDVGAAGINERVIFVELGTAQALLDIQGNITQIGIKLNDLDAAPQFATGFAGSTGLEAKSWIEENENLQEALNAQAQTGNLIKIFSIVTIVIGVASVLLVSSVRRRSEIGIMRSMGVSRFSITLIFVLQGFFIGLVGSVLGALLGWVFGNLLVTLTTGVDKRPGLPLDPSQGEYWIVILIATFASSVAAILPARSASKVDPVEVIQG